MYVLSVRTQNELAFFRNIVGMDSVEKKEEVVSKRWHNLFYILQFCYIFFWLCCFFLMHLATSCYIPIISGYK